VFLHPGRLRSHVGCSWCNDRPSLLDLISPLSKSFGAASTISGYSWALVDVGAVMAGARERFFAASTSVWVCVLVELVRWTVHNTGLSGARTFPAEAVEAIGATGLFLGCSM
jgi:hypothetical protein